MSSVVPTQLDALCPSLRELVQRGERDPRTPLDNLGMALRDLGPSYFYAEATAGTPAPAVVAIIEHLIANKDRPRFRALHGVIFYTLPELRHAIYRGEPLPIYFTGIDLLTLRFIPCHRTAEEVNQMLRRWNLAVEWNGKASGSALLDLRSVMPPD